jgi:aspartyl-tRNA(Asn)/glutamyl-tRNA(Gln) amidotransferase subunit A
VQEPILPAPTELLFLDGHEQARLIRSKEISPVDLVKECLSHIAEWDYVLRAWITVDPERALAQARAAEAEIMQGNYRGPLHGIPYGVKDQMHALGFPTTLGTQVLDEAEMRAPMDSAVIERLGAAGAILLGKQNLHEFGKGGTTSFPFGQPRNPWNPLYSASSSSSGSGIAPAAGFCTFSIGQDTGGSIRGPASCNGIVGLRPTYGRVSRHGAEMHSFSYDTIGPLARSVKDIANVLQTISGHDPRDLLSSTRPADDYVNRLEKGIEGLRIGVIKEVVDVDGISPEVLAAFNSAVDAFKRLGASIQYISLPLCKYAVLVQLLTSDVDVASWFTHNHLKDRYHRFDRSTRVRLATAHLLPGVIYNRAMRARVLMRREVLDAFNQVDALMCPTNITPPKLIGEINERVVTAADVGPRLMERRNAVYPFSVANIPAVSLPCGFSKDGLPVSLQLATPPFAEARLLNIANVFEQATGWTSFHPDLSQTLGEFAKRERADG